jgi:putative membrane-bound dehydrogenase-like protein
MNRQFLLPGFIAVLCATLTSAGGPQGDKFPPVKNSQNPKDAPPTPEESLKKITMPPGFRVTLFAGEPDVRQPIALSLDDRGRLWVAECYTYAGGPVWDDHHRDRVVILEDTDHDGHFDKRTVFWDEGRNLSGVAVGFGGAWVLCAPNLLFIPTRDGNTPSGPPQVVLDGWVVRGVGHNIVNGLTWGPDGWLYGRHGIQATSVVGPPGTPEHQRVRLNCAMWRYHPTRKVFEVVTHGTTNPWGFDYDDFGQMFFTNNVNGHLWHVVPGAHYKRMYGEDFNPHLYDLLDQCADHQHWDAGKPWTDSRDATGKHGELGGGHSHCGGLIYLGDNFPEQYRNTIFLCNTHGRRLNNDRLERRGCGYVGKHGADFFHANDPWFRGTALVSGPDGGMFISDWSDLGECHDNDGVHRTSGRIYKVTHGKPPPPAIANVAKLSNAELVKLQLHKNDFYVRAARRNLQERAAAGRDMKAVHAELRRMFDENPDMTRKLRAMWALHVTGDANETWLLQQLSHSSEHVRVWAIRLLVDEGKVSDAARAHFVQLARRDLSGLVRLFLASALQRLQVSQRGDLALALLQHGEDANDHFQPLMLWYGVEPLVPADPALAVELATHSRIPLVRRFISRRLTVDLEKSPGRVNALVQWAAGRTSPEEQLDVLNGMAEALRGWRKARPPQAWADMQAKLAASPRKEVRDRVRELGVVFGDGRAAAELRQVVENANADPEARRAALRVLLEGRAEDLYPLLRRLVNDRSTAALAMRGLAAFDRPEIPKIVLGHYHLLTPEQRPEAINTLVSRPAYAEALLKAVADGRMPRGDISAFQARQIRSFGREALNQQLAKVWGEIRTSTKEKQDLIRRYKAALTPDRLKTAHLPRGRALFNQSCATCHVLYGQGQKIGPDLTGSGRHNLEYLLDRLLDPNRMVSADFRMSVVTLKNGRVLTGVVGEKTERTVAVQTPTERVRLDRSEIGEILPTQLSLMPEGLLAPLRDEQVRDLIGYLMAYDQVPLPADTRAGGS